MMRRYSAAQEDLDAEAEAEALMRNAKLSAGAPGQNESDEGNQQNAEENGGNQSNAEDEIDD